MALMRRFSKKGGLKPVMTAQVEEEPGEERAGALAGLVLAGAIVLSLVGGILFLFQVHETGHREVWAVVGGIVALGGIASLIYFFERWGKL